MTYDFKKNTFKCDLIILNGILYFESIRKFVNVLFNK